ncbi:MAG TPA: thiamine pyrophosphate-dependent enzyme [Kofleriaceae bacterium]|nr:thiamine pyrophosphate-dependent enzyme [Kofleriaceae bacterium]
MLNSQPDPDRTTSAADDTASVERPVPSNAAVAAFGSDVVAETLRALDIPYIALNPGASYRGLHDSIVNFLGNERPQILLCLHEESAVAIAHGYAKVTGRAMAAAVHSNVGLLHATMAIFNAWCDRMPVIVLGATGPVDATKRRPWIDWIHTAADQGALVRHYTKWDDQPASPGAARESLLRAFWLASTAPQAPVYVNLDAEMQEARLPAPLPPIDAQRFLPQVAASPPAGVVSRAAALLTAAKRPLILAGRVSRDLDAWNRRVQLAEALGARVATDLKLGAAFPTAHPLHVAARTTLATDHVPAAIREADAILSLDWLDLAGVVQVAGGAPGATVVQVSLDHQLHNGWSKDHQGLPAVDLFVAADPDATVEALVTQLRQLGEPTQHPPAPAHAAARSAARSRPIPPMPSPDGPMALADMASVLRRAVGDRDVCLTHVSLSWHGDLWDFSHPLDYIGSDGGAGMGAGPGISVGAALALKGSGRMPIAICGDGDFMMGCTAIWTAAHYRIPLLIVVANNRSFYNDEVHQERMAIARNRPIENKWIGQRITDPDIDMAQIARAQGAHGVGPAADASALQAALTEAIAVVERGGVAVVDARIVPSYSAATFATMARGTP